MDTKKLSDGWTEYTFRPSGPAAEYMQRAKDDVMAAFLLGKDSAHCWREWRVYVSLADGVLRVVDCHEARARTRRTLAEEYLGEQYSRIVGVRR